MANKIQSVANLAVGPRGLHVIGADGKTVEQVTLMPGERRDLVLANPDGVIETSWRNAGELWIGKEGTAPPDANHPGAMTSEVLAVREELQAVKAENEGLAIALAQAEADAKQVLAKLTEAEQRATDAEVDAAEKGEAAARMAQDVQRLQEELDAAKAAPPAKPSK